ncbi:hypothetical protein [Vibrio phage S4-7]|nr:hypothetical protein [Vibrio phage S4-7]
MLNELANKIKNNLNTDDLETLESVNAEVESGEWDGAGDWFGHTDDCFDRGLDLGRAEAFKEVLSMIEAMETNNDSK